MNPGDSANSDPRAPKAKGASKSGGNGSSDAHPDIRSHAPGRIPESLIDAAIDGEVNEDIQREIAHALRYDPVRKQELLDTTDAINALQMPISTPDFTDAVLARADRNRRFIPASWRKHVRAGRLGIAAALLMTLMSVAGLQRMYPRFTTLASHPTPVQDIELAVECDTECLTETVQEEARTLRASLIPLNKMTAPGRNDHRLDIAISNRSFPSASGTQTSVQLQRVGYTQSTNTMYFVSDRQQSIMPTYRPLRLIGSDEMRTWIYGTNSERFPSSRNSATRIEVGSQLIEIDVPALP